jgi:hypothetical protein
MAVALELTVPWLRVWLPGIASYRPDPATTPTTDTWLYWPSHGRPRREPRHRVPGELTVFSSVLVALGLGGCSRPEPAQDAASPSSEDTTTNGGSGHDGGGLPLPEIDMSDRPDGAPWQWRCNNAGQDAWDPDTGWLAALPVYACPPAPPDAVEIELVSTRGSQEFWCHDPAYAAYTGDYDGVNWTTGCYSNADFYSDFLDGVEGAAGVRIYLSMPFAFDPDPTAYQGEWDYFDGLAEGGLWSGTAHAFDVFFGIVIDGEKIYSGISSVTEEAVLCLSRVRPDRLSGTVLHYDSYYDMTAYITFDMDAPYIDSDDSTCFSSLYNDGLNEADVWGGVRAGAETE